MGGCLSRVVLAQRSRPSTKSNPTHLTIQPTSNPYRSTPVMFFSSKRSSVSKQSKLGTPSARQPLRKLPMFSICLNICSVCVWEGEGIVG